MKSKSPKIETNHEDDFLYERLMKLLSEIKLAQGGNELAYTLRNHKDIKLYLISKQIEKIRHIEETYFHDNGLLNLTAIQNYYNKSLQNSKNLVN